MKIYYKTEDLFYYGNYQNFILPQITGNVNLGIDGSTTSFGFAHTNEDFKEPAICMCIREDESHEEFFSIVFPLMHMSLYKAVVVTATYEKTPPEFEKDTHAIRVMKNTEKAVGNFLSNGSFLNVKHKFNIYDIFPNSWKSLLVKKDTAFNYRKTDKKQNALDILETLEMDKEFWIKEANEITGHSYDAFEALGICAYGSRFVNRGVFTANYRNFKKRRPLQMLYKETSWDTFVTDAKEIKALLGEPPMSLMVPNEHHSFMENLYALDADDRINIMVVSPVDCRELHLYYQFVTGIKSLLMLTVTRSEAPKNHFGSIYI